MKETISQRSKRAVFHNPEAKLFPRLKFSGAWYFAGLTLWM